MTENSTANKMNSFRKQQNKEEMKKQIISFALMIFFTLIAFAAVGTEFIDRIYVIPIILIMAGVQVLFQFFYFMHMKDKGHEEISGIMYGGFWVTFLVVACATTIMWWGI